jgi:hypothetical protein
MEKTLYINLSSNIMPHSWRTIFFLQARDTTMQLFCYTKYIIMKFNERAHKAAMFLGVSKLHNTVWTKLFICKPHSAGILGSSLLPLAIKPYLSQV